MAGGGVISANCPSDSALAGFVDRRLSIEQRAALEVHVDGCASCRRLVIELSSGLQLLSAVAEAHTTHPARPTGNGESLATGTVVGRFVVLDVLGRGGMGVVYLAYDPELDRKVALKLLRPQVRDAGGARAQLLAEAQIMARINHGNVIAIYEVGDYRDQVFAAMELVEGRTLRRWLAEEPRSWREVVDVFLLAGEGVAAAHDARVVHRDFKPENVLLGSDGRVKVSDFGLAAEPWAGGRHVAGTPGYMAAESFQPGGADARGDQFSFCVALYEALHGRRPFPAQAFDDLVAQVRRGPAVGGRRMPARFHRVMRRGLALAPEDRYPSMRELLADIRRAVAMHRMRWLAALAVGALALAAAAVLVVDPRAASDPSPCAGAADQLAGVWDRARRDAVKTGFHRTTAPFAAASFERTAVLIDRYAAEWVAIRTAACEATEVRHEQTAALLDLRNACLDRARIQLRALGDALVAASPGAVRDAATAAAALPALDACSDIDALRAIVTPPLEPAARAQIPAGPVALDGPHASGDGDGEGDAMATRPDFRLPFACGEAWQLDDRVRRGGAQADFSLPGGGSSAGFAVFTSAPGWVSRVAPDNGEVDIAHGGGWFTSYQHMTEIGVSLHQYVGRGQVIGAVGNINVTNSLGGAGPAYLHYEQLYRPGVANQNSVGGGSERLPLYLERESFHLRTTGAQVRTSTNNCPSGGVPGSAAQYDVPVSTSPFSLSRYTQEILTRRADDRALFERWYDRGWRGASMPHTIVGRPAVAVFNGELHVIARKSDGTIFDLHYNPFRGWQTAYLEGRVSSDPDVAVYGWRRRLHVAARDTQGFLIQWWTAADGTWSRPMRLGRDRMAGTPALLTHYDALYVVARAADDSMWSWHFDRRGWWTESRLHGTASDNPNLGIDPRSGRVNVIARGTDSRIYCWQSRNTDPIANRGSEGWDEPEFVDPGRLVTGAPATSIYHGALHVFARGVDNTLHHWSKDRTWRWEATGGSYTSDPDVYHFGNQLQTFGRGPDGSLQSVWYDAEAGIWNVESHGVMISE